MAATIQSPIATSSPFTSMNPTTTEHDFRFPRRPDDHYASNSQSQSQSQSHAQQAQAQAHTQTQTRAHSKASPSELPAGLRDLRLDLSAALYPNAQDDFLKTSEFPPFQKATMDSSQSPEEMQKEDPLATQVWKFFSKTKHMLPNQQRMENLTWRMMALNLRKKQQEEERARSAITHHLLIASIFFFLRRFFKTVPCPGSGVVFFLFYFLIPTAMPLTDLANHCGMMQARSICAGTCTTSCYARCDIQCQPTQRHRPVAQVVRTEREPPRTHESR